MDNQQIITSSIVGGTVAAILTAIPFLNFINCFCCIGIMLGGAVGLIYYDRSIQFQDLISPATAVTLGIGSGLAGAFLGLFIEWFIYLSFGHWELDFLRNILANLDEVPPMMEDMMAELESEMSAGFLWGSILLQNLIIMPLFCLLGSLITRAVLNRNRPVQMS
jgi:hypothetical protein